MKKGLKATSTIIATTRIVGSRAPRSLNIRCLLYPFSAARPFNPQPKQFALGVRRGEERLLVCHLQPGSSTQPAGPEHRRTASNAADSGECLARGRGRQVATRGQSVSARAKLAFSALHQNL